MVSSSGFALCSEVGQSWLVVRDATVRDFESHFRENTVLVVKALLTPLPGFDKSLRALDCNLNDVGVALLTHPLLVQDFVKSLNALYLHVRWK